MLVTEVPVTLVVRSVSPFLAEGAEVIAVGRREPADPIAS